jgi:hypothetical protein
LTRLPDFTDQQLADALRECGSVSAAARHLAVAKSTLQRAIEQRGVDAPTPRSTTTKPRMALTRAAFDQAMRPPNNCPVKRFLSTLSDEERDAVEYGLAQDRKDLSAGKLRDTIIAFGHDDRDVPGANAINAHRNGSESCRCRDGGAE